MKIKKYILKKESNNYQIINLFQYSKMEGYNFEFDQLFGI